MPVSPLNQFGDLFVVTRLEDALTVVLDAWFPTYLAEVQRQNPPPVGVVMAPPASIATHRTDARWPDEALPSIVVQVPGTYSVEKSGDGTMRAWYAVTVLCVVAAATLDDTLRLSGYYAGAARGILMQQRDLLGVVQDVEWIDERHDRILTTEDRQRSLQIASLTCSMLVDRVVNARFGPSTPDDLPDPLQPPLDPYPPLTQVLTPVVDGQGVPVTEDP